MPWLFFISASNLSDIDLVGYLLKYHVSCCVDIRNYDERHRYNVPEYDKLLLTLKAQGITYLDFEREFGSVDARLFKRDGSISYKKAVADDFISKGLIRIKTGLERGYVICLLYSAPLNSSSLASTVVARYFSDTCSVGFIDRFGDVKMYYDVLVNLENSHRISSERIRQAKDIGEKGEIIASLFLEEKGYEIIVRNWNLHYGCELDIIAYKNHQLHFVEVKTRQSDGFAPPEYAVNRVKISNMMRAARLFMRDNKMHNIPYQLDCVAIVLKSDDDYSLKFIENIGVEFVRYY